MTVVLEAFHCGELVGRLPGGLLSQRYAGKRLLGFALLLSSLCTVLVPLTAKVHFSLVVLLRFIAGSTAVRITTCTLLQRRVSFTSFWKWVVLPQALKNR